MWSHHKVYKCWISIFTPETIYCMFNYILRKNKLKINWTCQSLWHLAQCLVHSKITVNTIAIIFNHAPTLYRIWCYRRPSLHLVALKPVSRSKMCCRLVLFFPFALSLLASHILIQPREASPSPRFPNFSFKFQTCTSHLYLVPKPPVYQNNWGILLNILDPLPDQNLWEQDLLHLC